MVDHRSKKLIYQTVCLWPFIKLDIIEVVKRALKSKRVSDKAKVK